MAHIVTLTTDFGPGEYVGAMKGVVLSLDPDAVLVDIDHYVRPHDVRHGAYVMYGAVPHFPFAVHVGVVDPGVGTARRGIVAVCEGAFLVGPDNGLLIPAARRLGLKEVRHIANRDLGLPNPSDTFHGRDLFAPLAARLLTGTKVKEVGPAVKDFTDFDFGSAKKVGRGHEGTVITHDRFGNVVTNLPRSLVERAWKVGTGLSVTIHGEGTRISGNSTSRMWPVRPMPPTVARNRSGSTSREHSRMRPSATRMRNARNNYLQDRRMQKTVNFTGIEDFLNHDACATESMGAIFDRSREHLGVSDKAVIAVRKFLLTTVKKFQSGKEPPHLARASNHNWFPHIDCFAYLLPRDTPWRERFDYLTETARKENPASFSARQKAAS